MNMVTIGHGSPYNSPLHISREVRRRHFYITGKTGTGKSTVIENMMYADYLNGDGFALLDPHGDLSRKMADIAPREMIHKILYFDPQDPTHVVGYNPLAGIPLRKRHIVTEHIVSFFRVKINFSYIYII